MPPEELKAKGPIDILKRDIWCLGVDIFYIIFGRLPFLKKTKEEIYEEIDLLFNRGDPIEFLMKVDGNAKYKVMYSILLQTLDFVPTNRVTIEQLVKNEIFQKEYLKPDFKEVSLEEPEPEEEEEKEIINNKNGAFFNSLFSDGSIKSYGLSYEMNKFPDELRKPEKNSSINEKIATSSYCSFNKIFKK